MLVIVHILNPLSDEKNSQDISILIEGEDASKVTDLIEKAKSNTNLSWVGEVYQNIDNLNITQYTKMALVKLKKFLEQGELYYVK